VSHVELMAAYALLLSAFFAILWRRERREQWKLFLQLFIGLIAGAIALAWLMYPFPSGPPQPIP
jgi:uncharacterized membrane protein YfcA